MLLSSKKLTFSLVCFIALFLLAAMPVMAGTIQAEWKEDIDDTDGATVTPGWAVTIGGLSDNGTDANDDPTVTYLDRAGIVAATAGTQTGFAEVADGATTSTGTITAALGDVIAVQVVVGTVTYQRVDFPAAAPGATLASMDLTLRPKLMDLAVSEYYVSFGEMVTVTFNFAPAADDTNGAPMAMLHVSDVVLSATDDWNVDVSGTNKVILRTTHAATAASVSTTVTLHAVGSDGLFALQAATPADGHAMVTYDNTAPTITSPPGINVAAPPGSPAPPDGVWGDDFPVFNLTFSVSDETGGSGLPDTDPVRIDTDRTKLDVGPVGLVLPGDANVAGTEYLVQITPKATRTTTAGEPVLITIVPMDKAGNEGSGVVSVKLALKEAPANNAPAFASGASISDITARAGAAITNVTLPAATDSDTGDTLTYSIAPTLPAGLTFTAATRVLSGTPTATMTETEYTYTVSDGTATDTLTFDITVNAASVVSGDLTLNVSAESYVIIHRSDVVGLPTTLPADASKQEWANMPELDGLFAGGGTLALTITKAADTALFDHDGDGANEKDAAGAYTGKKAGGADGTAPRQYAARDLIITEIMAALNEAYGTQEPEQKAHQWIEIYNPLKVDISGAKLTFKAGRPAADAAGTEVLLDRFSNQVGVGWQFTGLGENGFDDDIGTPGMENFVAGRANKDFVSFFRKERGKDGHTKAHWETSSAVYLSGHKGTPGVKERSTAVTLGDPSSVPTSDNVIFNEIGNLGDGSQWIEFKNRKSGEVNLKKWSVGIVTAIGTEKHLFTFPDRDIKIAPGKVLLVTEKAFYEEGSQLGQGYDITIGDADQARGVAADHPVRYLKQDMGNMPNGNFLLILRTSNDGKHLKTAGGGVQDIAGYYTPSKQTPDATNPTRHTDLWPFYRFSGPWAANNLTDGKVWRRNREGHHGHTGEKDEGGKHAWAHAGFTGGVGYKRGTPANNANGGTPGYPNGAFQGAGDTVKASVYISEIMYATDRRTTVQWIEIRNMSKSIVANLHNVRLTITNHDTGYADDRTPTVGGWLGELKGSFLLRDISVPPNQSVLVISARTFRNNVHVPSSDIYSLWDKNRNALGMKKFSDSIINPYGFYITLHANGHEGDRNKWQLIDTAGNLADPAEITSRRTDAQSFADIAWTLPDPTDEDGDRISIARRNNKVDGLSDGTMASAWILSSADGRTDSINSVYYGNKTDISTPGQTVGSPLPVELSHFRPTLENGKVTIRWTTESELDNAGFNILRSEARDGEFKQVNAEMIQGHGTTGERHTYKWVDESAKPNVVYYYQIEDVSFAGERQTLQTTKLKGLISARGKATTTWGDIKEVQ